MRPLLRVDTSDQPAAELLAQADVLAVVDFLPASSAKPVDPRHILTPLEHLAGPPREVWRCDAAIEVATQGPIQYARTSDLVFGHIVLAEQDGIRATTARAYALLLDWLATTDHPHLWRCWNVFGDITEGEGDAERYREFVLGRYQEFERHGLSPTTYPAATAIGGNREELFLMFVAGRKASRPIENPRQVSAFEYPRQYGPRSPSFARAALLGDSADDEQLLVSGTASVVGHQSAHGDSWQAQLDEILNNLRSLCARGVAARRPEALRLYLSAGLPTDTAVAAVTEALSPSQDLIALRGDICRTDLLLEVEGLWA